MTLTTDKDGIWYHGSDMRFEGLRERSTVTQWKELAEAFSHKPSFLGYSDDGTITHDGTHKGYLYVIDDPITVGTDVYQHPNTTMDKNAEFLTRRPLKARLLCVL